MNQPTSGFSGFSGMSGPHTTPEMIEYLRKGLEHAGWAEKARLQNLERDRLELKRANTRLGCMVVGWLIFVTVPFILAGSILVFQWLFRR